MTFLISTALPVLALMALAIALPYLWALVLPEGVPGLVANFALSVLVIAAVVSAYVLVWYGGQGVAFGIEARARPVVFALFLLGWVARTALAWLPMLVLGVAAQPRRWKEVEW